MVNVTTQLATPSSNITDVRDKAKQERLARIQAGRPPSHIRVEPANDDMRRVMKHPRAGKFSKQGSANWPNDRFTKRRIAAGDIKAVEQAEPGEQRGRRSSRATPHRGDETS